MAAWLENQSSCIECRCVIDAKKDTFLLPMPEKFEWDIEKEYKRSTKIERIMELLEAVLARNDGSKVVIFCHFLEMMDLLELDMGLSGIFYVEMRGSMSQTERKKQIKTFKTDKNIRVFISSI